MVGILLTHLPPVRSELSPDNPLYYTRWGYVALLGVTLFGGLVLNGMTLFYSSLSTVLLFLPKPVPLPLACHH